MQRNQWEEEDPEEDPDEDSEEDPSEGEPMEEEDPEGDPEEDSEISKGQLIGSEDLMGDQEEEGRDRTIQDEQTKRPEDLEEEINSLWNTAKCEIGVNY